MRIHRLKTWPEPFQASWDRRKTHEVRVDDRGYAVGDVIALVEFEPESPGQGSHTGRWILATVTYVTPGGRWGLPGDTCVMSMLLLESAASSPWEMWNALDDAVAKLKAADRG